MNLFVCLFVVLVSFRVIRTRDEYKMSLKNTREAIVLVYNSRVINDEDFCWLSDVNQSKNPKFPYEGCGTFDLAEMDNTECKVEFHLRKADISVLVEALNIPETFTCNQGSVIDGIEGLCF